MINKGKGWQTGHAGGLAAMVLLANYRKYRPNLAPTDSKTAQRSTTTWHGLHTKDEVSARGTGGWGKSSLVRQ